MEVPPKICVAVLAGGASRRMGAPKLLAAFARSTLVDRALDAALDCAADEVCLVTGAYHDALVAHVGKRPDGGDVAVVRNRRWCEGQASSVRAAVRHAQGRSCTAVVLLVADQPFVRTGHLNALMAEYGRGHAQAYLSANDRHRGNPCLFDRVVFEDLLSLKGDEGARVLFRSRRDIAARQVHFDEPYLFEDVDTPADLARVEGLVLRG
ncbi:nucleotidyltransferase family protein [Adlercreutzia sp. R21]|uniref:Nucleotidyltransferase family protein n=1 Tax=Adlercreutzia wanghongyangiae TaxID=3111451 RepID=A0ABU6IGG2_9ACTN|nr:nucleotidyltransferase family protein [Adlercreutzia sp. R21]MEC4175511.1 nucleotidyltransferase family protein [Adlercreutzia sp. R7]MEC4183366.1 nucleotidyltransferase family protein [Adlercreutzia sp. R21]